MYQDHWGLRETPFRACHDPRFFHHSPTHEEALARLNFLVEQHHRIGLLLGPQGSGKSLLLDIFCDQMRRGGATAAKINLLGLTSLDLFEQLALALGLNLGRQPTIGAAWRAVTDHVLEGRFQQLDTVLLLDDADRAGAEVMTQLTRLAQFDMAAQSRLTIVLSSRRERAGTLGDGLLDLVDLRIELEPWEQTETEQYLQASLAQAGCATPVFIPPAVVRLHQLAGGIPRRVRELADLSLLAGASDGLQQIDADVVESVHAQLSVGGMTR